MSFASLLIQTCDVLHYGQTDTDVYNDPVMGETSRDSDVPTRIQQLTADEVLTQRDTGLATHRAFFLPSQALSELDVVECDGLSYRVVGPPATVWNGTGPHHIEADLETVGDLDWTAYP